jgi:hypothetical protein
LPRRPWSAPGWPRQGCYLPRSLSGVATFAVNIGIWLMAAPEFDKGTLARTQIGPCGQVTGLPDRRQAYGPSPLVKFLHSQRCPAYGHRRTTCSHRTMQVSGRRPGRLRGRRHRRLSTDGHGRPRQKGPCPCPGAVPVPCAARRPASPGTGGRGGGRRTSGAADRGFCCPGREWAALVLARVPVQDGSH